MPFTYIWLYLLSPVDAQYTAAYSFGCCAIAVACILEMTAEAPAFVGQVFCFVRLKIMLDTTHILVRSVTFVTLVMSGTTGAIYAFGIAQLASAMTIVLGNYGFFHVYIGRLRAYRAALKRADVTDEDKTDDEASSDSTSAELRAVRQRFGHAYEHMHDFPFGSVSDMAPGVLASADGQSSFNGNLQRLVLSFAKQGVLKQVLTEGEKYVMSVSPVLSFSEQATYDIVNNMGSMAARFIFRPIEDSSYFYFTQTIARDVPLEEQAKVSAMQLEQDSITFSNHLQEKVSECADVLTNLCHAVSSIGLLAFVFGQSYAGTLLLLYGGADFVAGGLPETLLRWHCVAIILLAVNGITEGFMFSTNTSREIDTYNYYMAFFSVTFLVLSYQLTNLLGPVGFILANCTNMAFRIAYSTYYIHGQFRPMDVSPLQGIVPGWRFVAALAVCGLLCKVSEVSSVFSKVIILNTKTFQIN